MIKLLKLLTKRLTYAIKNNKIIEILDKRRGFMLNITDVRIKTFESENTVRAVATITIDDCFVIHDIRVIDGKNGLFVIMPGRKSPDGSFKDLAHPLDTQTRLQIQSAVLDAYQNAVKK